MLGIAGAFAATYGGQALHLYGPEQNAGFIGALIGAIVLLVVAGLIRKATKK